MGRPTSTIQKVVAGRLHLTHEILGELATALDLDALVLVEGTSFESILSTAVPTPESAALLAAKAELESLQQQLASVRAELTLAQTKLATVHSTAENDRNARAGAEARAERAEAQAKAASREGAELRRAAEDTARVARAAETRVFELQRERVGMGAQLAQVRTQLDEWRTYALERAARVEQLDEYIRENSPAGAAVAGGVLGFTLAALAAATTPRRKTRRAKQRA